MAVHEPVNILGTGRSELREFLGALGERPYRADQLMRWVHHLGQADFAQMTDLSRELRERLPQVAEVAAPRVESEQRGADGTRKWMLRLADGNGVEMVFIPEPDRGTLCVSSQAGCSLNCTFCATARQGFNRNLTSAEIVAQVWLARRLLAGEATVTNVVLMGMGEPLLNFEPVVSAVRIMLDDFGYGLSRRRVTLSTAGVVPAIDRLREACAVSLAVSLHAPDDALRDTLVPINKKYPIAELLSACRRYVAGEARRRVTFEYVMLDGVNDSLRQARALASLLGDVPAKVNLIPFNPFPGAPFRRSSQAAVDAFRDQLMGAGIMTVTRRPRGDDIAAACGQLAGQVQDRTKRSVRVPAQWAAFR